MKKIKFNDCICHSSIKNHLDIKNDLLYEIAQTNCERLNMTDNYYTDSISKLDWSRCKDFTRKWVHIFMPHFSDEIVRIMGSMGYNDVELYEMWYQQYLENDTHGWHIHGQQFTGVYYLEFPKGCSNTEIRSPFDFQTKQIDVVEGDIIVFPAHFVHRGLPNTKQRKTIISFNFDVIADKPDHYTGGTVTPNLNLKTLEGQNPKV